MSNLFEAVRENLSFLAVFLLVFVAVYAVAKLVEKKCLKTLKSVTQTRRMAYIAIFAVLSALLFYIEIPLFFAPSFYELDFAQVPVLISSFYLGPVAGVTTELVAVLVKLLIKGTSTAFVGELSIFALGCALVLPASIVYHLNKSKKTALAGMVVGTIVFTIFGSLFNAFYLLPAYSALYGMPLEAIVGMGTAVNSAINSVTTLVLFAVVPFNLLKGILVSVITFLLYKRVEKLLVVREQ